MKIKIIEDGTIESLHMIDPDTGCDIIDDMVGNFGGHEHFKWVEDEGYFLSSRENYEWWNRVISAHQQMYNRIAELRCEFGPEAVFFAIGNAGDCDFEDYPAAVNQALNEAFSG